MNVTSIPDTTPVTDQDEAVRNMVDFLSRTSHALALGGFSDVLTPFQAECLDLTLWSLVMALSTRPGEALPEAEKLAALLKDQNYPAVYDYCLNINLWWGV